MQGQESVGGSEVFSPSSGGQGSVILLLDSGKYGSNVSVCALGRHCLSPWKQEEGQTMKCLRQDVSYNLGTLRFANRTEPGTEQSLYSFTQVLSQNPPGLRYCSFKVQRIQ